MKRGAAYKKTAPKRNQLRRDAFFQKTGREDVPLVILGIIDEQLRRVVERDLRQIELCQYTDSTIKTRKGFTDE